MKVIYSSYWGSYLAVVAASLHLGLINSRLLSVEKIVRLPFFGKLKKQDLGEMKLMGSDNRGRRVYVMGTKRSGRIIERTFKGFAQIYGLEKEAVEFIDLMDYNNFYMGMGIFLIDRLGLRNIGMILLFHGIKKSFGRLRAMVSKVMVEPTDF